MASPVEVLLGCLACEGDPLVAAVGSLGRV